MYLFAALFAKFQYLPSKHSIAHLAGSGNCGKFFRNYFPRFGSGWLNRARGPFVRFSRKLTPFNRVRPLLIGTPVAGQVFIRAPIPVSSDS